MNLMEGEERPDGTVTGWMVADEVTVAIATIPPRAGLLAQALESVPQQTVQPGRIVVAVDSTRSGAAATKNDALSSVTSEYVAFLDDDDLFLRDHVERLLFTAHETGADVVYSWPVMNGMPDPRPDRFGKPFDADELRRGSYIPTTSLVRADLAQRVGGFQHPPGSPYDDWGLYLALLEAGATFHHLPERTWVWNVNGQNTSGSPTRW